MRLEVFVRKHDSRGAFEERREEFAGDLLGYALVADAREATEEPHAVGTLLGFVAHAHEQFEVGHARGEIADPFGQRHFEGGWCARRNDFFPFGAGGLSVALARCPGFR